jgi:hypothetical protein
VMRGLSSYIAFTETTITQKNSNKFGFSFVFS